MNDEVSWWNGKLFFQHVSVSQEDENEVVAHREIVTVQMSRPG